MTAIMIMPKTIEEFIDNYYFNDKKEVYTNGSDLIQVFRVRQALNYYYPKPHSIRTIVPRVGQNVILFFENGDVAEGHRNEDDTYTQYRWSCKRKDVIAWQPMPQLEE